MLRNKSLLFLILLILASCSQAPLVKIERLDFSGSEFKRNHDGVIDSFAPILDIMMQIKDYDSRREAYEEYFKSPAVAAFSPDMHLIDSQIEGLEITLGELKRNIEWQLPEVTFPKRVFGFITPYNQSVVLADTVAIIGLNHYLGASYEGYRGRPDFNPFLKNAERMPVDVAEALVASAYPYNGGDNSTVLSRMIYEGALLYAVKALLPNVSDGWVIGYDLKQMEEARDNEARVWQMLVERDVLFTTDVSLAVGSSYGGNAPKCIERYIGLQIVRSYVRNFNSDIELSELLSPEFYCSMQVLKNSSYSPKK